MAAIVFPTVFALPKSILFGGSLLVSIFILISGAVNINRWLLLIAFFFPVFGLAYSVYGLVAGTPGATTVLTVMVVYPLLMPLIAFTYKEGDAERLFGVFLLAAWLLVVVDIFYISLGIIWPGNLFVESIGSLYKDGASIDNSDDYFKFTLPNVSSLLFLFPFFISAFFSRVNLAGRLNIATLLLLMAALVILSGRRALFLAALVGPVVAYFVFLRGRDNSAFCADGKSNLWYFIAIAMVVCGFGYYFGLFDFYLLQVESIFDFQGNASNIERALQFDALVDGVIRAPIFGGGAGAAASYLRSDTQPWAYELSYLAFMFQYGIFGFAIYFFGVLLLLFGLFHSVRRRGNAGFEYCFFSGFVSFLAANSSNPYLAKFDYMWVIFIPFAVLIGVMGRQGRGEYGA